MKLLDAWDSSFWCWSSSYPNQFDSDMGWKLLPRALKGGLIATSGGDVIDLGWCETNGKERESHH